MFTRSIVTLALERQNIGVGIDRDIAVEIHRIEREVRMGERIDSVARGKLTFKCDQAEAVPRRQRMTKPSSKAAHRMRTELQSSRKALIGAEARR